MISAAHEMSFKPGMPPIASRSMPGEHKTASLEKGMMWMGQRMQGGPGREKRNGKGQKTRRPLDKDAEDEKWQDPESIPLYHPPRPSYILTLPTAVPTSIPCSGNGG